MDWKEFRKEIGQRFQYIITLVALYVIAIPIVYWLLGLVDFGTVISDWVEPRSVFLGLMVIYTIASFRTVGEKEMGLVLRFRRPIMQVTSGLIFVPRWICDLLTETTNAIEVELPGNEEQVWRATDENGRELPVGVDRNGQSITAPPGGWKRPIRITSGSRETVGLQAPAFGKPRWDPLTDPDHVTKQAQYNAAVQELEREEAAFKTDADSLSKPGVDDPLHDRLTTEPHFMVRFKIANFKQFVKTIGSRDEALRQIEDVVVTVAQREIGRRTPALCYPHMTNISDRIHRAVEILIGERADPLTGEKRDPWGIDLRDAYISTLGLTKTVNEAIAKAIAAGNEARELSKRGKGEGDKRKNILEGEAKGQEALAAVAETEQGRFVITTTAVTNAVKKGDKVIVSNPNDILGTLAGLVGVAKTTVRRIKKRLLPAAAPTPKPAPPPGPTPPTP